MNSGTFVDVNHPPVPYRVLRELLPGLTSSAAAAEAVLPSCEPSVMTRRWADSNCVECLGDYWCLLKFRVVYAVSSSRSSFLV